MNRLKKIILIITVIAFFASFLCGIYITKTTLPESHVYVCDNPKHDSEFDLWLLDEVFITWVPTYVIINDGKVIGYIEGTISEPEFTAQFESLMRNNYPMCDLPDYKIGNINGEYKSLKEIMDNNDTYILELSWIDCEECKYQDEHFTQDIYNKYLTNNIYRYYFASEMHDVKHKHENYILKTLKEELFN